MRETSHPTCARFKAPRRALPGLCDELALCHRERHGLSACDKRPRAPCATHLDNTFTSPCFVFWHKSLETTRLAFGLVPLTKTPTQPCALRCAAYRSTLATCRKEESKPQASLPMRTAGLSVSRRRGARGGGAAVVAKLGQSSRKLPRKPPARERAWSLLVLFWEEGYSPTQHAGKATHRFEPS